MGLLGFKGQLAQKKEGKVESGVERRTEGFLRERQKRTEEKKRRFTWGTKEERTRKTQELKKTNKDRGRRQRSELFDRRKI